MDEQTSGTPQQDPNTQDTTGSGEGTPIENPPAGTITTVESGAIVDKTLAEIASGVVKDVEHDAKDVVDTDVKDVETKVETKVNHEAHGILDELEQHLSQFDARAVAIYHGFLQRLRNAV